MSPEYVLSHGYVYFYERGLELLAPMGKLSYIVTNKWLRAGYGEPLRALFAELQRRAAMSASEKLLAALINEAYDLNQEDIDRLRRTSPPRTPF